MGEIWLIPSAKAQSILQKAQVMLSEDISEYSPSRWDYQYEVIGSVAILPITDVLSPKSRWSQSTVNIGKEIQRANKDESVTAIMIYMDCPGGAASKVSETAKIIANSKKPIVSYCESAESGGYWLASPTYIVGANDAGMKNFGNIGGVLIHKEISKQLEMEGVKVTIITADKSTDKGLGNPYEPLSKTAYNTFKDELNTIVNDYFIPAVQEGRGKKLKLSGDEPFTAKSYSAEEALAFGLIDEIGTAQDAFDKAVALGEKQSKKNSSTFNPFYMISFKEWFTQVKAMFNSMPNVDEKPAPQPQANATVPAPNPFEALQKQLNDMREEFKASVTSKEESAEDLKAQIETLRIENEKLKKAPAEMPTVASDANGDLLTQQNKAGENTLDDDTRERVAILKYVQEARQRNEEQ